MKYNVDEKRCLDIAKYFIENRATVRQTAKFFGLSKYIVYKDLTKSLRNLDVDMYNEVRRILDKNKEESSMRGGMATKRKKRKKQL